MNIKTVIFSVLILFTSSCHVLKAEAQSAVGLNGNSWLESIQSDTDGIIECYDCDETGRNIHVSIWGFSHFSQYEIDNKIMKEVTLIDLYNLTALTYKVHYSAPLNIERTVSNRTNANALQALADIKRDFSVFNAEASGIAIPKEIIDNPWRLVNCAYCKNDISDFINGSLQGRVKTVEATVINIAQTFDLINTSVPNVFLMPFEAGGFAKLRLTILAQPIKLEVEIIEVVDKDNNTISIEPSKLKGMNIRVSDLGQSRFINTILGPFALMVPMKTGIVTITCSDGTFIC